MTEMPEPNIPLVDSSCSVAHKPAGNEIGDIDGLICVNHGILGRQEMTLTQPSTIASTARDQYELEVHRSSDLQSARTI